MSLWRVTDDGPVQIPQTKLKKAKLVEADLEDWVVKNPMLLGEPLLVIGRQVLIPDTKDRLDVLAVDTAGKAVIIELKRGDLKNPVDVQALRYASYISKWQFDDFKRQARNFFGETGNSDFNFNEVYEAFCSSAGVDDTPDLNVDQRMIVVGTGVKEKLGSVALWLREHQVDIKVVEIHVYKHDDAILIEPNVIIPLPVSKFVDTGRTKVGGSPWVVNGRSWHLDQRCSATTQKMFEKVDDVLQDNFDLDGPRWNQKYYVAYGINNYNWLAVNTGSQSLRVDIKVKKGSLTADHIAEMLGVEKFDTDESLSEKFGLPSSVLVKNVNEQMDRIQLRIKDDFDLSTDAFLSFLREAHNAFPKK